MSHLKGKKTIASKITGLVSVVCWCLNSHPPSQKKITPSPSRLHHRLAVRRTWHRCNRNQRIALAEVFTPVFLIPRQPPKSTRKGSTTHPNSTVFSDYAVKIWCLCETWWMPCDFFIGRCSLADALSQIGWLPFVQPKQFGTNVWESCCVYLLCMKVMIYGSIPDVSNSYLGGGFKYFIFFHPYLGKWYNFTI